MEEALTGELAPNLPDDVERVTQPSLAAPQPPEPPSADASAPLGAPPGAVGDAGVAPAAEAAPAAAAEIGSAAGAEAAPPESAATAAAASAGANAPKVRSIKTPLQKEALEAAYKVSKFPDEDVRRQLGERIGLKEQQVQVWFSHKRRKEKKDQEEASIRATLDQRDAEEKEAMSAAANGVNGPTPMDVDGEPHQPATAPETQHADVVRSAPRLDGASGMPPAAVSTDPSPPVLAQSQPLQPQGQENGGDISAAPQAVAAAAAQEPASVFSESVQRTIDLAKAPRPPEPSQEQRAEIMTLLGLAKTLLPVAFREDGPPLLFEFDDPPLIRPDGTYVDEEPSLKRKRVDGDEDDLARYRRLSAGQKGASRQEAERLERERRRAEERAERERRKAEAAKTKEEARLKVLQEREERKLQAQAEKDRRAQERRDKLDERKKEKEMLKALQAQEKQATRLRQRDVGTGPRDDLDIEWETLLAAQREAGYASGTENEAGKDPEPLTRPLFPPESVQLQPLLPQELADGPGGDLLCSWAFLRSFGDLLGVASLTIDQLLQCLIDGPTSSTLGQIHIAMLRIVQADMEEAHATGLMQSGSAINFLDRAIVSCASMLEEAWAWGFDVDSWRAHLNPLTWTEVLRQVAITWGMGPTRPKPKKPVRPKMGTEGEDVVADEAGDLKLRLPVRFGIGTVKAAAWQVLTEAGPEGLSIAEIARRIQQSGLRDLRTSKTPEASVAGALSRDVIFARAAPATYALQAVVTHHNKLLRGEDGAIEAKAKASPAPSGPAEAEKAGTPDAGKAESEEAKAGEPEAEKKSEERDDEEEGESSGDEDEEPEEKAVGEAWVHSLLTRDYADLDLGERITILTALVHLTVDGPTIRNTLETRLEESGRVRKQMWEDAKLEKKRRQEEAAEKAKLAALEAQRVLSLGQSKEGSVARSDAGGEAFQPAPPAAGTSAQNVEDSPSGMDSVRATPDVESKRTEKPKKHADTQAEAPKPAEASQKTPGSLERAHSGPPPSEGGVSRRGEAEEDISAAAAAKQRQLQRAETIRKAEEANAIRGEPLGLDRRHNKYWRFADANDAASGDTFAGRLVVESHEDGSYRMLGTAESLEELINALDKRGLREGNLYNALLSYKEALVQAMPAEPMQLPPERNADGKARLLADLRAQLKALKLVADGRAAAPTEASQPVTDATEPTAICGNTVRAALLRVEAGLPSGALSAAWDGDQWRKAVDAAADPAALRAALAELEAAIEPGWLAAYYVRRPLLVRGAWNPTGDEVASALLGSNGEVLQLASSMGAAEAAAASRAPLAWLPATYAAIALRLHSLDASLCYASSEPPARETLTGYRYTQRPVLVLERCNHESSAKDSGQAHEKLLQLCGQPVLPGGRALPTLTPLYPLALMAGKQRAFSMDWAKLKSEIADEKAGILPPPAIPLRPPLPPSGEKGTGRASRAKNTRATKTAKGKAKAVKGSKAKSKQSALREEFDRQSEEEEAAERRGFSTPGFSDDDSDFGAPRGRGRRREDEEMEISD